MKYHIKSVATACSAQEVAAYQSCGFTPTRRPEVPEMMSWAYTIDGNPPAEIEVETVADLIALAKRVESPVIVYEDGLLQVYNDYLE